MSRRPGPAAPMLLVLEVSVTPALGPVTRMFAVPAVRSTPEVSWIGPALAVTLTALALAFAVVIADAPKPTRPPLLPRVTVHPPVLTPLTYRLPVAAV